MFGAALLTVASVADTTFSVGIAKARSAATVGVVSRVRTKQPVIALTFDACATATNAFGFDKQLFDWIEKEKLPSTFFLSGRWIQAHRLAAQAIADLSFVDVGNHSWDHPPFSRLRDKDLDSQIGKTEAAIVSLGRKSVGVRPPFGDWAKNLLPVARRHGLPVILWDVVSGDAGGHLSPKTMIRDVLKAARPGSIVIFHINGRGPFAKDALPPIVEGLKARGFRFVTVGQLLQVPDAHPVSAPPFRYQRQKKANNRAHERRSP